MTDKPEEESSGDVTGLHLMQWVDSVMDKAREADERKIEMLSETFASSMGGLAGEMRKLWVLVLLLIVAVVGVSVSRMTFEYMGLSFSTEQASGSPVSGHPARGETAPAD